MKISQLVSNCSQNVFQASCYICSFSSTGNCLIEKCVIVVFVHAHEETLMPHTLTKPKKQQFIMLLDCAYPDDCISLISFENVENMIPPSQLPAILAREKHNIFQTKATISEISVEFCWQIIYYRVFVFIGRIECGAFHSWLYQPRWLMDTKQSHTQTPQCSWIQLCFAAIPSRRQCAEIRIFEISFRPQEGRTGKRDGKKPAIRIKRKRMENFTAGSRA